MQITEIEERTAETIARLTDVWESAVRATHFFLSEQEIAAIKRYVPAALRDVPRLFIAAENGCPAAFMGIDGQRLEMLFVAAKQRGQGIGSRLLRYGMEECGVRELTVNEQNPLAVGFYEHMGFVVYQRSEKDEQGAPYPLLYLHKADSKCRRRLHFLYRSSQRSGRSPISGTERFEESQIWVCRLPSSI